MCVMAVFLRNCELIAEKVPPVARGSLCRPNTVGKHTLSVERVVFVDYRICDVMNHTVDHHTFCCCKRVVVLAEEVVRSHLNCSYSSSSTGSPFTLTMGQRTLRVA